VVEGADEHRCGSYDVVDDSVGTHHGSKKCSYYKWQWDLRLQTLCGMCDMTWMDVCATGYRSVSQPDVEKHD
jgi:hypothetical protein